LDNRFNPDLQLEHNERGLLAQLLSMPGYQVMHKVFRSEVDKFFVALINADPAQANEVLAKQITAKAAAQFYTAITERLQNEVVDYMATAPRVAEVMKDVTEDLLDMDDRQIQLNMDYLNLFEETE